ncbi:unnamed protein product [Rhodiola kirilowii]
MIIFISSQIQTVTLLSTSLLPNPNLHLHCCSMDLQTSSTILLLLSLILTVTISSGVNAATFTFTNKCSYPLWPGILPNAGSPRLTSTGFLLSPSSSRTFQAPASFSGRFWARTDCNFDPTSSSPTACSTGDCGSGQVECNDIGATPPVTLAEFTLSNSNGLDFYDVSLVDGYNVPMEIESSGGNGACGSTGCIADLNSLCPEELRAESGGACKSACLAFGSAEYCCSGAFSTPETCRPSAYSEMFKTACPTSYSYAYDDASSTFTCSGADYTITFCPSFPSQKSLTDKTPTLVTDPMSAASAAASSTESGGAVGVIPDGSWLAGLAMGGSSSTNTISCSIVHFIFVCSSSLLFIVSSL